MSEPMRVPMPSRQPAFVADDFAAHVTETPRYGRRFSMEVAEEALAKMGPIAVEHITKELAEHVVHRHSGEIERVVYSYINDRAWAEPIIRAAIYRTVREFVRETFGAEVPRG